MTIKKFIKLYASLSKSTF